MHPEQEANLEACVRKGFAIRLNKWTMKPEDLYIAIDMLLADKSTKNKIMAFRQELQEWDGPARAAQFLYQKFGKVIKENLS